ncbi:MAG TPA: metallophosphoesterase family protein [Opitutaceae bacterium]|nr:metallophosphoesterase family protein [Opitutaceae bacterium]
MKIAILADIHSNAPALEAVLADLSGGACDLLVQLGDAFNGPVDPAGVARLLRGREMIHIRGNGERMVTSPNPRDRSKSAEFGRARLGAADLEWIAAWPATCSHAAFFACHGSPTSDEEYLLEDPIGDTTRLLPADEINRRLAGRRAPLVLCAHSHVPRVVRVAGSQIVNPGSVGLPAYRLDSPQPHLMEVGGPCARYAVAERRSAGWRVSHVAVPYDHDQAAALADQAGFADWAAVLRTGYAGR